MKRTLFMCLVALPLLAACGDPGGGDGSGDGGGTDDDNVQTSCEGSLPNGSISVSTTGAETLSASIALRCGMTSGDYGMLPAHAPLTGGGPVRLQLALNEGQSWVLIISAPVETLSPGSYALTAAPDDSHGFLKAPAESVDSYNVTGGSLDITDVENVTLGPFDWALLDGSATVTLDGVEATVTFENLPVQPFAGQ